MDEQQTKLKPLNILPFKYRLFFRFSLFSYKIVNNLILKDIGKFLKHHIKIVNTRDNSSNIYDVPIVNSYMGAKRISIYLAIMINNVLKKSTNLPMKDFKEIMLLNLSILYPKFSIFVLKE